MKYSYRILFYILISIQVCFIYGLLGYIGSPYLTVAFSASILNLGTALGIIAIIFLYFNQPYGLFLCAIYSYWGLSAYGSPLHFLKLISLFFTKGSIQTGIIYLLYNISCLILITMFIYWLYQRFVKKNV